MLKWYGCENINSSKTTLFFIFIKINLIILGFFNFVDIPVTRPPSTVRVRFSLANEYLMLVSLTQCSALNV